MSQAGAAVPLSTCLGEVDTPQGRKRLAEYLQQEPYPHYEAGPGSLLVRIDANGKRTVGRFVNRKFQAAKRRAR